VEPSASQVLNDYVAALATGDVDDAMRLIADDAVFDVGRGRFEGPAVRGFLERLRAIHSRLRILEIEERPDGSATAVCETRDDDLTPLGIEHIRLDVEVELAADGRIRAFRARPTPESIAALTAARNAGRSSESVRLAEQAGTLPPDEG
jgi:hypothetical protein